MSAQANLAAVHEHTARVLTPPTVIAPQDILRRARDVERRLGRGRIHEAIEVVVDSERRRLLAIGRDHMGALWVNGDDAHMLADAQRREELGL